MEWRFEALNQQGERQTLTVEADSREAAERQAIAAGFVIVQEPWNEWRVPTPLLLGLAIVVTVEHSLLLLATKQPLSDAVYLLPFTFAVATVLLLPFFWLSHAFARAELPTKALILVATWGIVALPMIAVPSWAGEALVYVAVGLYALAIIARLVRGSFEQAA